MKNASQPILRSRTRKALDILRQRILDGSHMTGHFLPAERDLAKHLGISRKSLRNVLMILREEGLVRAVPGRGTMAIPHDKAGRLTRFHARCNPDMAGNRALERERLLLAVCKGADQLHAEVVLSFAEMDDFIRESVKKFQIGESQGCVFVSSPPSPAGLKRLRKVGIPFVVANLENNIDVPSTGMDFRGIGRTAARHLLKTGHRSLAVVSGPVKHFLYAEMLAGFRGVLAEENIYLKKGNLTETASDRGDACRAALKLLRRITLRPSALFTTRDIRAAGCYEACSQLGLKIPEDVSVVSYDDVSWPSSKNCGLTTVREPTEELGRHAVSLLAEWVSTGRMPEKMMFDGKLISRNSVRAIGQHARQPSGRRSRTAL